MKKCYDCGIELNKQNKTKEHIPAQNLFYGFSEEYKINRITVPACNECNNKYSKIDQEIRDVIGVINDKNENQKEITQKAIKNIMRFQNWQNRVDMYGNERIENISVSFSYENLRQLHIKNFKGVFYYQNLIPLHKNFHVEIIAEGDEVDSKLILIKNMFKDYLDKKPWIQSGHKDIFRFKSAMINLNKPSMKYDFSETQIIDESDFIVTEFYYHNAINPMVFAAKNTFLEKVKEKRTHNRVDRSAKIN